MSRTCPDCGKPIFESPGNVGAMKPFTSAMHTPARRNPLEGYNSLSLMEPGAAGIRGGGLVNVGWNDDIKSGSGHTYYDAWEYTATHLGMPSSPESGVDYYRNPPGGIEVLGKIVSAFPSGPVSAIVSVTQPPDQATMLAWCKNPSPSLFMAVAQKIGAVMQQPQGMQRSGLRFR